MSICTLREPGQSHSVESKPEKSWGSILPRVSDPVILPGSRF